MATRQRGSSTYTARPRTPPTQQPGLEDDGVPKCSGHQRRCKGFTSGRHTKNPGRKFYTCPLGQADPDRCKFFKWADEVDTLDATDTANPSPSTSSSSSRARTLGQSPAARFGKPTVVVTPAARNVADDIHWDEVDTESLERDAIAASPRSSQATPTKTPPAKTVQERLIDAAYGKRMREHDDDDDDDDGLTPKRPATDDNNPFLSPNRHPISPPHPSISPALSSLKELSERLYRQDRLLHAADVAKEGFRKRIQQQQERIDELERRVKDLEK